MEGCLWLSMLESTFPLKSCLLNLRVLVLLGVSNPSKFFSPLPDPFYETLPVIIGLSLRPISPSNA